MVLEILFLCVAAVLASMSAFMEKGEYIESNEEI